MVFNQLSIKIAMLKRWISIISGKSSVSIPQGIGKIYSKECVQGYYNDLTGKLKYTTLFDKNGIPLCQIGNGKYAYFPIAIIQYGLASYDDWLLTNSNDSYRNFSNIANWLIEKQEPNGSWNCFGLINSSKYRESSMCQGEAASLLIRKFRETNNIVFYDASKKAIDYMLTPIEEGGTAFYNNQDLFLEEYPLVGESNTVLNGWIFSIFGLYDFKKVNNEKKYDDIYRKTIQTLAKTLPKYDLGYWSKYDLSGKIASPAYQALHVALLNVMFDITGDNIFLYYSEKWNNDLSSKHKKYKAIIKKVYQKIFEKTDMIIIK